MFAFGPCNRVPELSLYNLSIVGDHRVRSSKNAPLSGADLWSSTALRVQPGVQLRDLLLRQPIVMLGARRESQELLALHWLGWLSWTRAGSTR